MELRVAPALASFGGVLERTCGLPRKLALSMPSLDEAPGCPGSCTFRLYRRWSFELPRLSHPSALPGGVNLRVAPQPYSASLASRWGLRVAPHPHLPALPRDRVCGLPRILSPLAPADAITRLPRFSPPPAVPLLRLRVAPGPALTAGPMMTPRLTRTLHPRRSRG
jgi:hypothetical protein